MWRVIISLAVCFIVAQGQVTLEESGSCVGQGNHTLSLSGLELEDTHGWNITQDGLVTFWNGTQARFDENGTRLLPC